jgi:hypothetical protein
LVRKPDGKIPLGGTRRRWKGNIKVDLREIDWEVWIGFIWRRVGTGGGLLCENGNEPSGSIKGGELLD